MWLYFISHSNIFYQKSEDNGLKAVFFVSQPIRNAVEETLEQIISSSHFQYVLIVTNMHPNEYEFSDDHLDELKDKCLIWMRNGNYTCDIIVEHFPFACFPINPNANTTFFLNPLARVSQENLIGLDTYQRLVKQEITELHTLAANPASVNKEHFQQYYQILSPNEVAELKVRKSRTV